MTALLGDLAVEAVAQKTPSTCLSLSAVAGPVLGSAEEEAEAVVAAADLWAAGGAGSTAGPVGRAVEVVEEEAAAVAAVAEVVVVVVVAAVSARPGAGAESGSGLGAAGHCEK